MRGRARSVAVLGAVVTVGIDAIARIGTGGPLPDRVMPLLVALGALCVVGLTSERLPTVAWLAAIVAASIAAIDVTGSARDAATTLTARPLRPPVEILVSDIVLVVAGSVAAGYAWSAMARWRRIPATFIALVVVPVFSTLLGFLLWDAAAIVSADPANATVGGLAAGRWEARIALASVVVLTGLGALADASAPFGRARERARIGASPDAAGSPRRIRRPDFGGAPRVVRAFVEELVAPLARSTAIAAREGERSRVAADLHAVVMPELRMAVATADAQGAPIAVTTRLRDALAGLESVMAAERSPILETFGLVAALEWLSERTEERSEVRVTLDVRTRVRQKADGAPAAGPRDREERPPRQAERAAFRVAQLALDNVVRHAPAAAVVIEIEEMPALIELTISDDGPGVAAASLERASQTGRRGLEDMREEARSVGADVEITSSASASASGTVVRFSWRSRGPSGRDWAIPLNGPR